MKPQFGESLLADFEENTWTFEMPEDFKVISGNFAIIKTESYNELLNAFTELTIAVSSGQCVIKKELEVAIKIVRELN